ncbi:hypothetical protein MSAN_00697900 [Mycena sanguinolenta]|uniref:Large ribosomal subunit protein uL23m n=1 Tax=Mycena sanguinolenta TaxID=230812 RepID=A0A8H6Z486_9AGAR|nr:hypothetical protein MSAN_00697900 [Mycena sanguinolenta]
MLRPTLARLYASSKKPTPPISIAGPSTASAVNSAIESAQSPSESTPESSTHGLWRKPHIHNPLYKKEASLAQARSRPLAVRLRRAQRYAQELGLPPSTDKKPTRRLELDEFLRRDEEKPKNIRIPRIRGMTVAYHKGTPYTVKVEGQKIYLPNIVFRLMRNHTPPGQPYNPWQATFRIPKNLTKTDIRSYLMAVYGVQTTYIRTDNYHAELGRRVTNDSNPNVASYKRAVVGLVEPFYYPLRLEDMAPEERETREAEIEEKLQVKMSQELERVNLQNQKAMQLMPKNYASSTYWTKEVNPTRAQTLKRVAGQRARRESLVSQQVDKWRQQRAAGEPISIVTSRKLGKEPIAPEQSDVPSVV